MVAGPTGRREPNTSTLRRDIDSGRTGDKVDAPDPAAAPLGADDEAAGAPPRPADVELARAEERGPRPQARSGRAGILAAIVAAVIVTVVIILVLGVIGQSG